MTNTSTHEIGPATRPWSIWASTYVPDLDTFSDSFSEENQAHTRSRKTKTHRLPAKHPVIFVLESVKVPVTNGELARLMGVSDGEASKRWREVAHLLEVARVGKERRIRIKRVAAA
jgi:hypothetical protein